MGYAQLRPTLVVDGGGAWGLHMGAPVRLRLWGGEAGAGRVRKEDWDSLSDWGQVVRALKLGSEASAVALWVGAMEDYSLLSGHLVRRYSNRAHPDYHPAGGYLTSSVGPLFVEVFSSDMLGARLVGAQAEVDLTHVLSGPLREPGRYTLGLSAVRDWGGAGGQSPQVTLAHVDGTAVVVVRPSFELHVLAGWGGHPDTAGAWGAVAGVGADALTSTLDMKLRLEVRRQRGGFRQGYFGPDYELARLSAVSRSGTPVTQAPFPKGFSAYGEAVVGWDGVRLGEVLQRHLHLSVGAEVFDWGRVDVDGRLAVQLAERSLEVAVSGLARGLGQQGARHLYSAEVRWRFGAEVLREEPATGAHLAQTHSGATTWEKRARVRLRRRHGAPVVGTDVAVVSAEEMTLREAAGVQPSPEGSPSCGGQAVPEGWPDSSSWWDEELLAPFFQCTSRGEELFIPARARHTVRNLGRGESRWL